MSYNSLKELNSKYCAGPLILAKAALNHEQLLAKIKAGCKGGIEIQILSELMDKDTEIYKDVDDVFNLEEFAGYDIRVVHAPIISKGGLGDMTLENLCDIQDSKMLDNVFKIANYFGKINNRNTLIVVHSEMYYNHITSLGDSWERIVKYVKHMLEIYPYTEIAIENVSPLRGVGKDGELHLSNNFKFDNVQLAMALGRDTEYRDRIGTVLDTCHAMLTEKYMTALYNEIADRSCEDYSMREFFVQNSRFIKLVHLAGMKGSGYGKGRYGTPFTMDDKDTCYHILDLYQKYGNGCMITLEVEEDDFMNPTGFTSTLEVVNSYYNRGRQQL